MHRKEWFGVNLFFKSTDTQPCLISDAQVFIQYLLVHVSQMIFISSFENSFFNEEIDSINFCKPDNISHVVFSLEFLKNLLNLSMDGTR